MQSSVLPPMYENRFLAHSLGGYKRYKYLNAEDGLKNAIACGYRYFEVDFKLTEDDEIVCTHGWSRADCEKTGMLYHRDFNHMTKEKFLAQRVHGMETMDVTKLYSYMVRYPDFYWELDLHTLSYKKSVHMAEKILEAFHHNEAVMEHCLVQVNSMDMYHAIDSVYHFKYYQYNVKNAIERLDEFIDFCQKNQICAMALKKAFATEEVIAKIRNAGLALLVFTVDNKKTAEKLLELGANTICTNFINIEQHVTDLDREKEACRLKEQEEIDKKEELEWQKTEKKEKMKKYLRKIKRNLREPHKIPGKLISKLKRKL